jgi:quinol monooxygenase YgiN
MPEIAVVATFVAKPAHEEQLRETLQAIVGPTRKEPGALQYDLHRDIKEPRRFVFFERWESEEALALHNKAPHIESLSRVLPDLIEFAEINVVAKL